MTPILRLYACIALISGAASALKGNQYSRLRGQGSKNTHLEGGSRGLQKGHKGREAQLEQYSDSEQDFFNFCTEELLSDAVVGDGIISQNDFGDKMGLFCRTFTAPTFTNVDCPATTFTSLSVDVQLIFLIAVCPEDEGKTAQMDCLHSLDSLNGMGADFGYIVSSEMMPEVENTVENLCFELVPVVFGKLV